MQIARGPPGIAPGIAAGIVYGKWSVQIAQGAPGIAPGIARHCPRQVVLAAWIYDMMCVCCVSLSLSLALNVFPLWCVLKRFREKHLAT